MGPTNKRGIKRKCSILTMIEEQKLRKSHTGFYHFIAQKIVGNNFNFLVHILRYIWDVVLSEILNPPN